MQVDSVLVTGANRGIGLEFVRQLVRLPKPPRVVFATYRSEGTLQDLQDIRDASTETQVVLIQMDVSKTSDIERATKAVSEKVGDKGLNLLINNAGVARHSGFPDVTEEDLLFHFTTNTVGPVMVLKAMLPLLQRAASQKMSGMSVSRAAVINISAQVGSITETNDSLPKVMLQVLGYRTTKAALNMAMRVVALTIKDQGILVVNICPGWVKTDMGSVAASLTPQDSISAMLKTFSSLDESHHGTFMDRDGNIIPF